MSNNIAKRLSDAKPINVQLHSPTRALAKDALMSLHRVQQAEAAAEDRLHKQRQDLAKRVRELRRRSIRRAQRLCREMLEREHLALLNKHATRSDELIESARDEIVELALRVARHVLEGELSASSKSLTRRLTETIRTLPGRANSVSMHAKDARRLAQESPPLPVPVVECDQTPIGVAHIHTSHGDVTLDWANMFAQIADALRSETRFNDQLR